MYFVQATVYGRCGRGTVLAKIEYELKVIKISWLREQTVSGQKYMGYC